MPLMLGVPLAATTAALRYIGAREFINREPGRALPQRYQAVLDVTPRLENS